MQEAYPLPDLEEFCARVCLLSTLEAVAGDPPPLTRNAVSRMIEKEQLHSLVLRSSEPEESETEKRARQLLTRTSAVYAALDSYRRAGYHFFLPDDPLWPKPLAVLQSHMPLYLFAKGSVNLLNERMISVVGSRSVGLEAKLAAEETGRILAEYGIVLITGGAQGVDSFSARAALSVGGSAIIIPAVKVSQLLSDPVYQRALDENRLLILCETPPDEPFSATKALKRNHSIYALGAAAMVIASREGRGGTWAGAKACIRAGWRPVFVLDAKGKDFSGNAALAQLGAGTMHLNHGQREEMLFTPNGTLDSLFHNALSDRQATLFDQEM